MNARLFVGIVAVGVAFASAGCGGDKKGPRSPDDVTETSASGAKEDMPPAPSNEGATAPTDTHTGGAGGGMLTITPMKVTAAKPGKDDKPVELKADGSVLVGGKTIAKVKGDEVDSAEGTSMVTVGVTGALVGNGVKSGLKFEGDEVTGDDGSRLSVGDDGTITSTKGGKSEPIGKVEGGTTAKRTALVLAVLWLPPPAAAAPAPAPAGKAASTPAKKK